MSVRLIGAWDLPGHSGPVYALTCDYERKSLFSAGADGYIAEWRCATGKHAQAVARTPNAVYALHFASELRHLYIGESTGVVYVLDLSEKKLRRSIRAHKGSVFGLNSHPSDPEGWSSGRDGYFLYWDTHRSEPFAQVQVAPAGLRGFILSPRGDSFLCAGRDGYVYEVSRTERTLIKQVQADTHFVFAIQSSPKQNIIATGGKSGYLKLWDANLHLLQEKHAHAFTLNAIAWHPNGHALATGGRDRYIHIWDIHTGEKLLTLSGHQRSVNALIWLNPETLASAGDDGMIKMWHLEGLPE
ncbi:MAG: hypothetical protein NZZ60_05125 [Bacteroidia bacterium]|nr:hypothetical protein [Bacteroidia bacterium]MCX7652146.1 hypothetical protein [Bacteroidia bacterium]MDW8416905.1 hypothetical protein [Bacteroidia bacterium]